MAESWEILSNYQSQELIRRRYKDLHDREANASHAAEISSHFIQGAAYFASARDAERTVRPLLLYYGVLALSRGAAILLRSGRREASLSQSHGLTPVGWAETLAMNGGDVGDLRVRATTAGSLQEFADATSNKSLLRLSSSGVTQSVEADAIGENREFTLAGILSRLPELADQYARWRPDGRCAVGTVNREGVTAGPSIVIQKQFGGCGVSRDRIQQLANGLDLVEITENQDSWVAEFRARGAVATTTDIPGVWDYVSPNSLGIGRMCLIGRYDGGWHSSKPVAFFVMAYFLGMLARYFPSKWTAIVRNISNDCSSPTLMSAMARLEQFFPQIIVDFLEEGRPTQ